MSKTNIYQPTEKIMLQLNNVANLYINATIANFTRPISNVFDKSKDYIAALNQIKCTVPKYATPNDIEFVPKDVVHVLGSVRISLISKFQLISFLANNLRYPNTRIPELRIPEV